MKYLVLFFALIGFFLTLAQEKQVPFPLTTQIEPDYYNRIEKVEDGFITVSKTKGGEFNASEFKLVKFDFDLKIVWERELFLNKYENITQIFAADHVNLLINEHNDKEKTSVLKRYSFDLENGKDFKTDTLFQFKVKDWLDYTGKVL